MQRSLSTAPGETETRVPWALPPRPRQREEAPRKARPRLSRAKGSFGTFGPSTLSSIRAGLREQQLTLPYRAPRTIRNVPIGGARRRAAQSRSLERIGTVKGAVGATVSDDVMAIW